LKTYIEYFKNADSFDDDRVLVDQILDEIYKILMGANKGRGNNIDQVGMGGQIEHFDSFACDIEDGEKAEEQVALLEEKWLSTYRYLRSGKSFPSL
jgi:hypothetical protein